MGCRRKGHKVIRWVNACLAKCLKCESISRRFQPRRGPSRGLLRDCGNFADGSFAALIIMMVRIIMTPRMSRRHHLATALALVLALAASAWADPDPEAKPRAQARPRPRRQESYDDGYDNYDYDYNGNYYDSNDNGYGYDDTDPYAPDNYGEWGNK